MILLSVGSHLFVASIVLGDNKIIQRFTNPVPFVEESERNDPLTPVHLVNGR